MKFPPKPHDSWVINGLNPLFLSGLVEARMPGRSVRLRVVSLLSLGEASFKHVATCRNTWIIGPILSLERGVFELAK